MPPKRPEPSRVQALPRGALDVLKKQTPNGVMDWEIWVEKLKSSGHGRMVTCFGLEGGKKQTLSEIISEGKNEGRRNATTPYEQACLEAAARWEKQKSRKGYGLTAEESATIRGASPMLAQTYDKAAKKVNWETAFAQPKLDGFRALARREGKKVVISSRENQPIPALAHIADILKGILPEGVTLDGEMYCHGMPLNKISSACKRKSDLSEKIQYHVYDLLSEEDFAARATDIYAILRKTEDSRLQSVKTVKVRSEGELMVAQKSFLEDGYEGAMLRHGRTGYEAGKRSAFLLKVKTFQDAEFTISDYKMGRGKYEGMPVFTCTTDKGHDFDVLAPGDLEEKRALGTRAKSLIGKTVTVKYQYFTKTEEPVPFLPVAIRVNE